MWRITLIFRREFNNSTAYLLLILKHMNTTPVLEESLYTSRLSPSATLEGLPIGPTFTHTPRAQLESTASLCLFLTLDSFLDPLLGLTVLIP